MMRMTMLAACGLATLLTGCFGFPTFMKQQEGRVAYQGAIEIAGTENETGIITGAVSAASTLTQVLRASPVSSISAASVAFPPGSLALDTVITLEEGTSLATSSVATTVGLTTEKIQAAAPAVVVSSSTANDALVPFTIALPLDTSAGLFAQTPDLNKIVVLYLARKHAEAFYVAGLVPKSQLTIKDNTVLVTTSLFGSYQVIYTADEVTAPVEAKTDVTIVTKRNEIPTPTIGDNIASMFSMAVAYAAEMPTCDTAHLNQLVYVEDTREFKVCRAGGWGTVSSLTGVTSLTFPSTAGAVNKTLKSDGSGGLVWSDDDTAGAGSVTSTAITDDTITNADINATAAISGTKISPNFGAQNVVTTGTITGVEVKATGFLQTGTVAGTPAAADCDAAGEYGRLRVDTTNNRLYTCSTTGWVLATNNTGALLVTQNLADVGDASLARTNIGLGALATKSSIANGDVDANAAIAGSKISPNFGAQNVVTTGSVTAASFSGDGSALTNLPAGALGVSIDSAEIVNDTITDADISPAAAISGFKVMPNFTGTLTATEVEASTYVKTGTSSGMPSPSECDQVVEYGRLILDSTNNQLFVCAANQWIMVGPSDRYAGRPALVFTTATLAASDTDANKNALCSSEYGPGYTGSTMLESMTALKSPDLGATALYFNVVGNGGSMKITSSTFSNDTGASYPVACINIHAPLRFTSADVSISAPDGSKDSACQSEYGAHYVAATFAQTVSLARYTPMASGYVAATVKSDTTNMVSFGTPAITLAASSASVKVACRFVPQD